MSSGVEKQIQKLSESIGKTLSTRGLTLATAESCTGGWVGKAVTDVAGSSAWYDRGWVTYTNEAKTELLGVSSEALALHGAVSESVVIEMAKGALARGPASWALAVSGIAGPSGGTPDKPAGTVWFAWAARDGRLHAEMKLFKGDREAVRAQSVVHALGRLQELLSSA